MLAPPIARTVHPKGKMPVICNSGNMISSPHTTPNNMAPSAMLFKIKDKRFRIGLTRIRMMPRIPATMKKVCQDPSKDTPGMNFVAAQSPPIPATRERITV